MCIITWQMISENREPFSSYIYDKRIVQIVRLSTMGASQDLRLHEILSSISNTSQTVIEKSTLESEIIHKHI